MRWPPDKIDARTKGRKLYLDLDKLWSGIIITASLRGGRVSGPEVCQMILPAVAQALTLLRLDNEGRILLRSTERTNLRERIIARGLRAGYLFIRTPPLFGSETETEEIRQARAALDAIRRQIRELI